MFFNRGGERLQRRVLGGRGCGGVGKGMGEGEEYAGEVRGEDGGGPVDGGGPGAEPEGKVGFLESGEGGVEGGECDVGRRGGRGEGVLWWVLEFPIDLLGILLEKEVRLRFFVPYHARRWD